MLDKNLVKSEMDNLVFMASSISGDKKKYNSITKKYKFLSSVFDILNSSSSESFLKEQLLKIEKDISRIRASFVCPQNIVGKEFIKLRAKYFINANLPHLRNQRKHIKFCLKNKL